MSCYNPLRAFRTPDGVVFQELSRHDILGRIDLACGQCIGCRMRRASDWELRVMHEAASWDRNCFVTLTYAPGNLPSGGSLLHRDFQLFMKRLRKSIGIPVRFYMCGEYGPLNLRPHYHACLFNVDFRSDWVACGKSASGKVFYESRQLSDLWSLGRVSVQDLTRETASYCARYIMKKVLGPGAGKSLERVDGDGVITQVRPEYAAMSLKPGIGANWFCKYMGDVYPGDYVISDGVKRPAPKYYDKLFKRGKAMGWDDIEFARELRAIDARADNTEERLAVREVVQKARYVRHVRSLE